MPKKKDIVEVLAGKEKYENTLSSLEELKAKGEVSEMKIDYDGDGTIDEEKEPVKEMIEVAIEKPTSEKKGIPGFEAAFAVAGLLAVAYVLRKKR